MLRNKTLVRKVACAMSGGVDSAVSAALLKQKGYEVIGVFMQNWDQANEKGICTADLDREDATYVCDKLQIPLCETNFVKEYWNDVFSEMVSGYENGATPNPDVLCNKHIKFGAFFNYVMTKMDVDAMATGHYAQNSYGNFLENRHQGNAKLLLGRDRWKDQTLFLAQIPQSALQNTMFPVGSLFKKDVKKIAESLGLERIVQKKESVGMCFIGNRKFQDFIEQYVSPQPGVFIDIETGSILGEHKGTHYWTIGQRSMIGGQNHAYYVAKMDTATQNIYLAPGVNHPALYYDTAYTDEPFWISGTPEYFVNTGSYPCHYKYQHIYQPQPCRVDSTSVSDSHCDHSGASPAKTLPPEGVPGHGISAKVTLQMPIRAIALGQYFVFYEGEQCLGSSKILRTGPSLYERGVCEAVKAPPDLEERFL